MKKTIHSRLVDDSFEEFDSLAAVAAEDSVEDLDGGDDTESDEDGEGEDEGDEDFEETEEDDSEEIEEVELDEEGDESDDSEDFEETEEDDSEDNDEAEGDDEEFEEIEEDDSEAAEDCDASEEVDEDSVLAALEAEGLCVVISTSDMINESEFGVAVAEMEDSEFENEEEYEEETEDDDVDSEDIEDFESEVDEDETSEDDSEESEEDFEETEEETEDDDVDSEDVEASDDEEFEEVEADEESEDDLENVAPVASVEFLARASVDDVDFVYHNNPSNPVWNVIVAGVPAARMSLASYGDKANEVATFFSTDKFAQSMRRAMASEGVLNLLRKSNAEFYATSFKQSELFGQARAAAEQVATSKLTTAVASVREDLVDALKIVSAGMDKNYFPKTNHLKREMYIALSNAGVHNPARLIDNVFATANAKHFETLADLAVEFIDKPAEAREVIRDSIEGSGVIDREKEAHVEQEIVQPSAQDAVAMVKSMAIASASGPVSSKESIRSLFHNRH